MTVQGFDRLNGAIRAALPPGTVLLLASTAGGESDYCRPTPPHPLRSSGRVLIWKVALSGCAERM